ncbi:hypothetical protein [Actibacterium ureilyticum]|uniref:hypothetical protein n=1 Tax=Actibacterium ureilyticum TaxID=1590614 RepID=UPI000BAAFF24|nr:hypothetical protein [Actibacterium ureilyticum]
MTAPGPGFDIRQSVRRRNATRLAIVPLIAGAQIWLGLWLIPAGTRLSLEPADIGTWTVWSVAGALLVLAGFWALLGLLVFAIRARSSGGAWHFRLTDTDLLWQVPRHAHGPEEGFAARLDQIAALELRIIRRDEAPDRREYWIRFHDRAPIRLRDHSGVSLSWLADRIHQAGVPVHETVQDG